MTLRLAPFTAAVLLLQTSPAHGQSGYEWDHPDNIGVRYLLYQKLSRADPTKNQNPNLRAQYVAQDEDDIVRVNGFPYNWGLVVYEFPKKEGETRSLARDFADYVLNADPGRTWRQIVVEGKDAKGSSGTYRYWEYYDRMKLGLPRPRAGGDFEWEQDPSIGVRFKTPKDTFRCAVDGPPQVVAKLIAESSARIAVDNRPLPVTYEILLFDFSRTRDEESDEKKRKDQRWATSLEDYVTSVDPFVKQREFLTRAESRSDGGVLWEFVDDVRTRTGKDKAMNYHTVACQVRVGEQDLALMCRIPVGKGADLEPAQDMRKAALTIVTSLEPYHGTVPAKHEGEVYYHYAGVYDLPEKEVALVAFVPVDKGDRKPDSSIARHAKKMIGSLERD